ncbi:recombinase [Candidatus Bathyarchaeota archaeon]|nr:MAG: recombinase [Candidatus Bathyarchaeota archaeon]
MTEAMVDEVVLEGMDLIYGFIDDCRLRSYSPETIRSHRSNLRTINGFFKKNGLTFQEVDKDSLRKLLGYLKNTRRVGSKTVESYYSALSSFYEYLIFEDMVAVNPVPSFRKRYLAKYKNGGQGAQRKLLSVEDMSRLINGTLEIRDRALMAVLAKTGVRRGELISMDVGDVDWSYGRIKLKSKNKRSNLYVYFDEETAVVLSKWLRLRDGYAAGGEVALFVGDLGKRIGRNMVYRLVTGHAERLGFHDPDSSRLEDHFSPHCFRHWFTTHLRRNGLSREFIKELRGDSRGEAIDIYDHIDHDELRKAYLAAIPRLGIA